MTRRRRDVAHFSVLLPLLHNRIGRGHRSSRPAAYHPMSYLRELYHGVGAATPIPRVRHLPNPGSEYAPWVYVIWKENDEI